MAREAVRQNRRAPVDGYRSKMNVRGKEPGYEYYWANDEDSRISDLQDRGWEVVNTKDVSVGDRRVDAVTSEGSPVAIPVGGGVTAVLMRIKKEWYDEDQSAKLELVRKTEEAIKRDSSGDYGSIKLEK